MSYRSSVRLVAQASKSVSRCALRNNAAFSTIGLRTTPLVLNQRFFSNSAVFLKSNEEQVLDVLKSEIRIETDLNEQAEQPEIVDTFLETSGFNIVESSNRNLAEIVKDTGDKVVHVYFDVSQITNIPEPMLEEENIENNEEYEYEDDLGENFANVNIVIEKKADNSALSVEVLVKLDDGTLYIESVTPYSDSSLALSESAESETVRQLTYHGPPYSNLDEHLQESFEEYIRNLGLNESFHQFLCEYSQYKENKEYFSWLKNITKFFS